MPAGAEVLVECKIKSNSKPDGEISITVHRTTDKFGVYTLDIPPVDGFYCTEGREPESFCRATQIASSSPACNLPGITTSTEHIGLKNREIQACLYNLNALSYRPANKNDATLCGTKLKQTKENLNSSLFFWPPFPWPFWPPSPFPFPFPPLFPSPPSIFPPLFPSPPSIFPPLFPSPPPSLFPPLPPLWPQPQPPPSSLFPPLPPVPSLFPSPPPPPPSFPFPIPPLPPFGPIPSPPLPPFTPIPSLFSPPPPPPPSPPPPFLPFPLPPLFPTPGSPKPPPHN